jgi:hypothetical protein
MSTESGSKDEASASGEHRGIPAAKFIENVAQHLADTKLAPDALLQQLNSLYGYLRRACMHFLPSAAAATGQLAV